MNVWPSVCIIISGVEPAVSPKSYSRVPAVRLGQADGSTAMARRAFRVPASLSLRNGNTSQPKWLPPPWRAMRMSG